MKKIKLIALALSICCVGTMVFAGCGDSKSKGSSDPNDNHGSVSLPKKIDGDVIKVLAYDGWEREHEEIRKTLKDYYNATVEYTVVPAVELQNKIAVELVSGNTYDFTVVGSETVYRDLAEPITKYFDLEDPIFQPCRKIAEHFIYNGELYAVPSIPHMEAILYNKTLIENLGYEAPLDMFNKGEWTFDTFKQLITSLANEKTSDGEKVIPFSSWDLTALLKANGTDFVKRLDHKKFELNLNDPKVRESLNFFRDITVVTPAFESWQGWSQADFQLGKTAMIMDRFGNKTHFSTDLAFDWDFVPWPKGPSGDDNVAPGTVGTFGVPKGSKNPSGGAAYAYLFMKQDFNKRKEYLNGYLTPEQVKRFEALYPKISMTISTECGIKSTDDMFWKIADGKDVTATMEELKPTWQSEINTYVSSLKK